MPTPPDELRGVVPSAPPDVPALLVRLVRLIEGWRDEEGERHPGLMDRLDAIEGREAEREADRAQLEAQRLDWRKGRSLTVAGGLFTQFLAWAQAHFK